MQHSEVGAPKNKGQPKDSTFLLGIFKSPALDGKKFGAVNDKLGGLREVILGKELKAPTADELAEMKTDEDREAAKAKHEGLVAGKAKLDAAGVLKEKTFPEPRKASRKPS